MSTVNKSFQNWFEWDFFDMMIIFIFHLKYIYLFQWTSALSSFSSLTSPCWRLNFDLEQWLQPFSSVFESAQLVLLSVESLFQIQCYPTIVDTKYFVTSCAKPGKVTSSQIRLTSGKDYFLYLVLVEILDHRVSTRSGWYTFHLSFLLLFFSDYTLLKAEFWSRTVMAAMFLLFLSQHSWFCCQWRAYFRYKV